MLRCPPVFALPTYRGVGDNVAPVLQQLGIPVTIVDAGGYTGDGPVFIYDCRCRHRVRIKRTRSS